MIRPRLRHLAALAVALCTSGCAIIAAADPNALWSIVNRQCVPVARATGGPGFCTSVDLSKRYAILKDINGNTQYLLIPTDRVMGIESPSVLDIHAPEYWADAWNARQYVGSRIGLTFPPNQLGLEINSKYRRTQQQLHIHMDCMQDGIIKNLAHYRTAEPGKWHWTTLDGNRYRVMRILSLTGDSDPFRIVARDRQGSDAMAQQTILVTGAGPSESDGWLVVNSGLELDDGSGTAEGLLDHSCEIGMHQ
ncbi:CDP-diacylglycerol diphosphatase [Paraburkholderia diazotrophica]|uniref:CDP-diacylglycerol pyrophosphatase n=1 Tax=Paraburkholderia diazotrophica TaxID=667676 RepID=A0A1H6VKA9_9BURK|nr:CDP-diacylglycerol diphosphatase [Paraburkholderia diazotrophica]SEJ03414.1 CDP-diacylglycerol pyrophosphatase [Paraburkholderia diazotrophica]